MQNLYHINIYHTLHLLADDNTYLVLLTELGSMLEVRNKQIYMNLTKLLSTWLDRTLT